MKPWLAATGVFLALSNSAIPAASAQSERALHFGADCFAGQDTNGDGRVTLLEARAAALAFFEFLDANADDLVSRAELVARAPRWRRARAEARFVSLDRDRDGALSSWETSFAPLHFARIDQDGDGRLSLREWRAAFARETQGAEDTTALRSDFWRRDIDHDGVVTRNEMLADADQRFLRSDRDGNGVLTRGEIRSTRPRRR